MEALFHCDLPYSQSQDFEKRYSVALENVTQAERSIRKELPAEYQVLVEDYLKKAQRYQMLDCQFEFERGFMMGSQIMLTVLLRKVTPFPLRNRPCPIELYPNDTGEKDPNRVGFGVLACAILKTDPIGNFRRKYVLKIGYVRVSTQEQNTIRQEILMRDLGVDQLYVDRASGKNANRPELWKMLAYVRQGDTVIVESISRFARNTRDLLDLVEQLTAKQVEFISQKEAIDTTTPTGKFMLTIFGAVAELEREYILQRQREGIAIAKEQGKYKGRKPIMPPNFEAVVHQWRSGEITAVEAMRRLDMKSSTFYRKVKRFAD